MRIGRTGVFTTKSGKVGLAAVVAITSSNTLVAKEPNSGALIEFERGEFNCFNSCGSNPNAANVVRKAADVTESSQTYGSTARGYDSFNERPQGTIALADFELGSASVSKQSKLASPVSEDSVSETTVHVSPSIIAAIRQAVRQAINKKRIQPVQRVRASVTTTKTNKTSASRSKKTAKA